MRSKMYSLFLPNDKEKKTSKGVKRSFVSKYIRLNEYANCLFDEETTNDKFRNIRIIKRQLHTTEIYKIALSPYDVKRYLVDNWKSRAYGHYKTLTDKKTLPVDWCTHLRVPGFSIPLTVCTFFICILYYRCASITFWELGSFIVYVNAYLTCLPFSLPWGG